MLRFVCTILWAISAENSKRGWYMSWGRI